VNILFYCNLTQHVSGAFAPIIRNTSNCIYSHRCCVYTDKIKVVEGKTVKTAKNNLEPVGTACQRGRIRTDSATLACGTYRFKVIFCSFYSFTFYDFYLISINMIPVAVNTVTRIPDDGCKCTRNMLSKIAVK
jgi:hypothetical protein